MIGRDEALRIVAMRRDERMTFREIAAATGRSLSVIHRALHRQGVTERRVKRHRQALEITRPDAVAKTLALFAKGISFRQIAAETGISLGGVVRVVNRVGQGVS